MFSFEKKVVLITGGASGIGKALAVKLASQGMHVGIADIDAQAAQKLADEIGQADGSATAIGMDVCSKAQVRAGLTQLMQAFGGIDVLINNAGTQHIAPLDQLDFEQWRKLMAIHLDGAFLTTQACLQAMYGAGKGGTIIYMGSVHSKQASVLKGPYVTAKHGLIGLSKVVAKEGAAHGVRSYVVCPGFVKTPLVEKQIPLQAKALNISQEEVVRNIMLKETIDGEFTSTEDIVKTTSFLIGFPGLALSGQSFVVSHGWHMQ